MEELLEVESDLHVLTVLYIQPAAGRGGSDRALLRMVRTLAHGEVRCHVVVPSPHPLTAELETAGATVHVVPMRRITRSGGLVWWLAFAAEWPVAVARLVGLIRRTGAEVVHSNSLHSWYGWAAARLTRRPHVWHAREVVVQSSAALGLERILTRRFADLVPCASAAVAAQLPGAATRVVLDDVDRHEFTPARAGRFRPALGIADDTPLVALAGRVDTWKGVEVTLEAWPAVRSDRPDAELVIAGGPVPDKEGFYAEMAERAGALAGVHWLGERDDIPDLFADADVVLSVATEPEPYGLSLVEALASGASVVATEGGGPPEIVARARPGAGLLVPPGDPPALSAAVLRQLPARSSSGIRRERPVLLDPVPPAFPALYREVLEARHRRRPGVRGPRRRGLRSGRRA